MEGVVMDELNPSEVLYAYHALGVAGQSAFLDLLAGGLTARDIVRLSQRLPQTELAHFVLTVREAYFPNMFPIMQRCTREVMQDNPGLSNEEIDRRALQLLAHYGQTLMQLNGEQFRQKRDRRPNKQTILRNADICRRKAKGESFSDLAEEYKMARNKVVDVWSQKAKWLRLRKSLD
jgi:hypothetical protein